MSHVHFALDWTPAELAAELLDVDDGAGAIGASVTYGDRVTLTPRPDGAPEVLGEHVAGVTLSWRPDVTPGELLEGLEVLAELVRQGAGERLVRRLEDLSWLDRRHPPGGAERAARARVQLAAELLEGT